MATPDSLKDYQELLSTIIGLLEILDALGIDNEVTRDAKDLVFRLTSH